MFTSTYARLRARLQSNVKPIEPAVCTDCGIDTPTTWHWDGCKLDPRAKAKR